ncbi:hypothetical protein LIA77_05516 [Sarocladium implicatum]|nr:hypothetical protein LIA77_05516 [Sarocladium implicatum]
MNGSVEIDLGLLTGNRNTLVRRHMQIFRDRLGDHKIKIPLFKYKLGLGRPRIDGGHEYGVKNSCSEAARRHRPRLVVLVTLGGRVTTYTPSSLRSLGSAFARGSSVNTSIMAMFIRMMSNLVLTSMSPSRSSLEVTSTFLNSISLPGDP